MRTVFALFCLLLLALSCLGMTLGAFLVGYLWDDIAPEAFRELGVISAEQDNNAGTVDLSELGIEISVECPPHVESGESFVLAFKIKNSGEEALNLTSIELYDRYLDAFSLLRMPKSLTTTYDSESNYCRVFEISETVEPGEEKIIAFFLQAEYEDVYRGDAVIRAKNGHSIHMLQTVVGCDNFAASL